MGISISAKLLYGMRYSSLVDGLSEDQIEQLDEDLEYGGIEYASPYYYSDKESWFVGYELPEDFDFKGMRVFTEALEEIEGSWVERFGVYGTVQAVKHVY